MTPNAPSGGFDQNPKSSPTSSSFHLRFPQQDFARWPTSFRASARFSARFSAPSSVQAAGLGLAAICTWTGGAEAAPPAIPAPAVQTVRGPVIDVHVHTEPGRYALAVDLLAANDVTRFINLSGGSWGRGLAESIEAAREFEGRILVCANLDWRALEQPDFGEAEAANLAQAAAAGARCLKISKALGLGVPDPAHPEKLLAVDTPLLDPVWAAAGRLGLPVFIHTGDPKAFFEPLTPQNERWDELGVHPDWSFADPKYPRRADLLAARDRVVARHPGTTFVGVHFGNNSEDIDYVDRILTAHPNLYVDIAARLPEIGRHDPAKVRAVFDRHQDRILFGTDLGLTQGLMLGSVGATDPGLADVFLFYADHFRYLEGTERGIPHPTPIQGRWTIDAAGIPPAILQKVYRDNALKLFWKQAGATDQDWQLLNQSEGPAGFFE